MALVLQAGANVFALDACSESALHVVRLTYRGMAMVNIDAAAYYVFTHIDVVTRLRAAGAQAWWASLCALLSSMTPAAPLSICQTLSARRR